MEMNVIYRNIERLVYSDSSEREAIEPMSEWKWQRLYLIAQKYGIGPWIADGIKAYEDDFFLQPSPTLRQQLLDMAGERQQEKLERYELAVERSKGFVHKLSPQSLRTYGSDLITAVKNIEE